MVDILPLYPNCHLYSNANLLSTVDFSESLKLELGEQGADICAQAAVL
jgi:hypothetical protein